MDEPTILSTMKTKRVFSSKYNAFGSDNTVYISEGEWYNPFGNPQLKSKENISRFKSYILRTPKLLKKIHTLKGKRLACTCLEAEECHGDVLAFLAENLEHNDDIKELMLRASILLELPPSQKIIYIQEKRRLPHTWNQGYQPKRKLFQAQT
jgi:hypothetical protein